MPVHVFYFYFFVKHRLITNATLFVFCSFN